MKKTLLLLFLSPLGALLFGQSITPVDSPYDVGETLVFDYSGGTGATTDWIGVYLPGETPDGDPASTTWGYISATSGQFSLAEPFPNASENPLQAGDYVVYLFCCDGYDPIASANFSIVGAAPANLEATSFPS